MLVNLPTITQLLHGKAQVRIVKSQLFIMMVQSLTIRSCHYQLRFNDSQVPSMLKSSLYMESLASTDKERHPETCSLELLPTVYSSIESWTPESLLRDRQSFLHWLLSSMIR